VGIDYIKLIITYAAVQVWWSKYPNWPRLGFPIAAVGLIPKIAYSASKNKLQKDSNIILMEIADDIFRIRCYCFVKLLVIRLYTFYIQI